jgi:hypothetical protein
MQSFSVQLYFTVFGFNGLFCVWCRLIQMSEPVEWL